MLREQRLAGRVSGERYGAQHRFVLDQRSTVGWAFADGQTVGNAWNATLTQSGAKVIGADAGCSGSLDAGGSMSFDVTGSAPTSPVLTCTSR